MRGLRVLAVVAVLSCAVSVFGSRGWAQRAAAPVGIFEDHSDVGTVLHAGSVEYDSSQRTYTISGGGENMWLAADAFQYVWKKVSGDVTLTADISFLNKSGNEHKKAVLILRQSLDADSVYADVALHASGLTSLQFRDEKGTVTHEIQSNTSAPRRLRIAKRGDYVYMSLAMEGEPKVAGGWLRIPLRGEFYVGLGVCSHDKDVVEKAVFSHVELTQTSAAVDTKPVLYSALETIAIDSADRRVAYLLKDDSKRPTGRATAPPFCSIAMGTLSASRSAATSQPSLTRASPLAATTITAFRRTPHRLPSAITPRAITSRSCISCPSRAGRHAASRRILHRTGTVGRPMGRRWHSSASAMATSIFIRSRRSVAKRHD
jgi:hypothetical protein